MVAVVPRFVSKNPLDSVFVSKELLDSVCKCNVRSYAHIAFTFPIITPTHKLNTVIKYKSVS